jgi:hypothetical protein
VHDALLMMLASCPSSDLSGLPSWWAHNFITKAVIEMAYPDPCRFVHARPRRANLIYINKPPLFIWFFSGTLSSNTHQISKWIIKQIKLTMEIKNKPSWNNGLIWHSGLVVDYLSWIYTRFLAGHSVALFGELSWTLAGQNHIQRSTHIKILLKQINISVSSSVLHTYIWPNSV